MVAPGENGSPPPHPVRQGVGLVGVGLLVAGLVLVGSAFILLGEAEQSESSCFYGPLPSNCTTIEENAANTSVIAEYVLGVGVIVAGVGGGVTGAAMIGIMARREAMGRSGTSPGGPSLGYVPSAPEPSPYLSPLSPPPSGPSAYPPHPPSAR